jgi:hypothetical protein
MASMNGSGKAMSIMHNHSLHRFLASLLLAGPTVACTTHQTESNGTCLPDPAVSCSVNGFSAESIHLAGYSCTGSARPDENSTYIDGVPQGMVCADEGVVSVAGIDGGVARNDGKSGYCCTNFTTQCSLNPAAICDPGNYGYQCLGANRPEAVNPAISCNQGIREANLINYCCSGTQRATNCTQSDAIGCVSGMTGWTCPVGSQPTAQDMGANKSRADSFYLLCPVPTIAANPKYQTFCCFIPGLNPVGGTCLQNMTTTLCAPGRFGIACYGPDTPEQNFQRLSCPEPGAPGLSEQGYPSTIYCCDYTRE